MKSLLPRNPAFALSLPLHLKLIRSILFFLADLFGFWKKPWSGAPTNVEYMSFLHKLYWLYKSQKPIKKTRGYSASFFMAPLPKISGNFVEESRISFSAIGDLMNASGLENSAGFLYSEVKDLIFNADISFGNLEAQVCNDIVPIEFSQKEATLLGFTLDQYLTVRGHKGKRFTILQTATNHSMDFGEEGLAFTSGLIEKDNILLLGTNSKRELYKKALILEKKGIKIGFISATFGLNGKSLPPGKEYLVHVAGMHDNFPDLTLLESQISDCQKQDCDMIIASLHWGYEYEFFPRVQQIETAHKIIELGADMIMGHHPHVLQPMEYYRPERDKQGICPIIYSLGNLTSPFSDPALVLSGILNGDICKGNLDGRPKTCMENIRITPVVQWENAEKLVIKPLQLIVDENKQISSARSYINEICSCANMVAGWAKLQTVSQ